MNHRETMPILNVNEIVYIIWQYLNSNGYRGIAKQLWRTADMSLIYNKNANLIPNSALRTLLSRAIDGMKRNDLDRLSLFGAVKRIHHGCHEKEGYYVDNGKELDQLNFEAEENLDDMGIDEEEEGDEEEEEDEDEEEDEEQGSDMDVDDDEMDGDIFVVQQMHPRAQENPPILPPSKLSVYELEAVRCKFNPVSNVLATTSSNVDVTLHELEGTQAVKSITLTLTSGAQQDVSLMRVTSFNWNNFGTSFVSTYTSGVCRVWSSTGNIEKRIDAHSGPCNIAKFNENGELLATGGQDGKVVIWNANGSVNSTYSAHRGSIADVVWISDYEFATCASDEVIHIFHIGNLQPIRSYFGHNSAVVAIKFDKNANQLASLDENNCIKIWAKNAENPQFTIRKDQPILAFGWNPRGRFIACTANRVVELYDTRSGEIIGKMLGHLSKVRCLAFSPNGLYLASGDNNGNILVWDLTTLEIVVKYGHGNNGGVSDVDWNTQGTVIAATTSKGKLILGDVETFV
ncbi:unnamed protein product [Caenorhabditis angaria]|uniref:LisH domain-containing protein n=1 Tax=Caenorhabditis angaria TaxID=860376 RepID=A0A9P1ND24_9PELO|nr:unnamed protein product [Caenorhabditis angaria]